MNSSYAYCKESTEPGEDQFDYKFKVGAYFIEATLNGTSAEDSAIPGMPYWKGTVVSNQLRFEIPRH